MKVYEIINESMDFSAVKFDEKKKRWSSVFPNELSSRIDYDHPDYDDEKFYNDFSYEPPENKKYRPDLDMNLSNSNMINIMRDTLGFKSDEYGYDIPINDFITTASRWYMRNNQPSEATPTTTEQGKMRKRTDSETGQSSIGRGATIMNIGRRSGYEQEIIQKMISIAKEGKKYGATHINAF